MITNFRKKQKSNTASSFFSSPFVKFFFILIIVFLLYTDVKVYKDRKKLNSQIDNLKEKIETIQKKNSTLEQGIVRVNDKDYIEKVAREELDLQIQNEKEINTSVNFFNPKTWLGWFSNSWQWIKSKF